MNNFFEEIKDFRTVYYGEWLSKPCEVKNHRKENCPNEAMYFVEYRGKTVGLCSACYQSYLNGFFDRDVQKQRNFVDRFFIG